MLSIEKIKEITKDNKEKREQKIEKRRIKQKAKLIKKIDKEIIKAAESGSNNISFLICNEYADWWASELAKELTKYYKEKGYSADSQYSYRQNAVYLFVRWDD